MDLTLGEVVMPTTDNVERIIRVNDDGMTVGYLRYCMYDDAWVLDSIYVIPFWESRGKGLATSMLEEFMALAADAEVAVVLHVAASENGGLDDEQLEAWYRRHGFKDHPVWYKEGPVLVGW